MENICINCKHFNPTVTTSKTWGKCENKKNDVRVIGLNVVNMYIPDEAGRKEVRDHFDDSIRYPEEFGCIFFEPLNVAGS